MNGDFILMSHASPPLPIFVYGALRSGTTLLRLMLKSHARIQSPGEADFLFDYISPVAGGGWTYDRAALRHDRIFRAKKIGMPPGDGTDLARALVAAMAAKDEGILALSVHRGAQKMAALFPETRIIHLLRDPRDVARSSIGMGWAGNSYFGVDHWIDTEQDWDAAGVPRDRVLTVRYETLMADLEANLVRICGFLGLSFDPAMLKYYENSTYGPPDPNIAQKWKQKAGSREIALIEGRVGPLLAARGYEPAGSPAIPGSLERAQLAAESRIGRWRYNIRRYGLPLFVGHHAARTLGLKGVARKLADRQEAIRIANLK